MTQENPLRRYTVYRDLGRGAIGRVYAVHDKATGANVALKTLDRELFNHRPNAERFLREAHSAGRLKHPNIVEILDAGEAEGTAYVAMELLKGESLRKILDDGPLPIARAMQIAHDVASGLAHAHLEGVVHGGIKPSNIIVLRSGIVKITDFGMAQLAQAATLSAQQAGLGYMSPEQLRGDPVDHRSDIFSLGAMFYEMLTHRPPFEGSSAKEMLENILHAKPPPPSEQNQNVPRSLDGIVLSMLAGRPDERMPGLPILLRDLERLQEGLGLGTGAAAGTEAPAASVPPVRPAPRPAAFQPASEREPVLRTPERIEFPDRAPMQDVPRFAPRDPIPREEGFYARDPRFMTQPREPEKSSGSRAAIVATLALLLAMLSIGLTAFLYYPPDPGERRIALSRIEEALSRTQEAPATAAAPPPSTAPASAPSTAPAPASEAITQPAIAPPAPEASPPRAARDASAGESSSIPPAPSPLPAKPDVAEEPARADPAPAPRKAPRASQPAKNIPEPRPRGTASLIIAVSPQGELYVDGRHYGTTPPITTLDLEPGMHSIEIRRSSRKPYLTYVTVEAGEQRRIRHDFDAPPIRPPS